MRENKDKVLIEICTVKPMKELTYFGSDAPFEVLCDGRDTCIVKGIVKEVANYLEQNNPEWVMKRNRPAAGEWYSHSFQMMYIDNYGNVVDTALEVLESLNYSIPESDLEDIIQHHNNLLEELSRVYFI